MKGLLNATEVTDEPEAGIPTEDDVMGATTQKLAEPIEEAVSSRLDDDQNADVEQVLDMGMELLFGEETHERLFSGIRPEDEVPVEDELGAAATNIMLILHQKSGGIPGHAMIPAGTILLARATDFINESGLEKVSTDQFAQAVDMFTDSLSNQLDPEYVERMKGAEGGTPTAEPPSDSEDL